MKIALLIIAGIVAAGFILTTVWFYIIYMRDKRRLKSLKAGDDVVVYIDNNRTIAKVVYVDREDEVVTVTYLNLNEGGRFFTDTKIVNIEDINFPTI